MTRKSGLLLTDGREVYQSFGGRQLLKTGILKNALEHLVYRCVDEIILCVGNDQTFKNSYWDELYDLLSTSHIGVPITLVGGYTKGEVDRFLEIGIIERLGVNSSLFKEDESLERVRWKFGKQFLIAHIPFFIENEEIFVMDYSNGESANLSKQWISHLNYFDEISFHDIRSHGFQLNTGAIETLRRWIDPQKIIYSGGLDSNHQLKRIMQCQFAAVALDNEILYDGCFF